MTDDEYKYDTRDIEDIRSDIYNWDLEDVSELLKLISELDAACKERHALDRSSYSSRAQDYIDMNDLPTAYIPDWLDTGYPVWALDKSGMCIVGDGADSIESAEEVWGRDWNLITMSALSRYKVHVNSEGGLSFLALGTRDMFFEISPLAAKVIIRERGKGPDITLCAALMKAYFAGQESVK